MALNHEEQRTPPAPADLNSDIGGISVGADREIESLTGGAETPLGISNFYLQLTSNPAHEPLRRIVEESGVRLAQIRSAGVNEQAAMFSWLGSEQHLSTLFAFCPVLLDCGRRGSKVQFEAPQCFLTDDHLMMASWNAKVPGGGCYHVRWHTKGSNVLAPGESSPVWVVEWRPAASDQQHKTGRGRTHDLGLTLLNRGAASVYVVDRAQALEAERSLLYPPFSALPKQYAALAGELTVYAKQNWIRNDLKKLLIEIAGIEEEGALSPGLSRGPSGLPPLPPVWRDWALRVYQLLLPACHWPFAPSAKGFALLEALGFEGNAGQVAYDIAVKSEQNGLSAGAIIAGRVLQMNNSARKLAALEALAAVDAELGAGTAVQMAQQGNLETRRQAILVLKRIFLGELSDLKCRGRDGVDPKLCARAAADFALSDEQLARALEGNAARLVAICREGSAAHADVRSFAERLLSLVQGESSVAMPRDAVAVEVPAVSAAPSISPLADFRPSITESAVKGLMELVTAEDPSRLSPLVHELLNAAPELRDGLMTEASRAKQGGANADQAIVVAACALLSCFEGVYRHQTTCGMMLDAIRRKWDENTHLTELLKDPVYLAMTQAGRIGEGSDFEELYDGDDSIAVQAALFMMIEKGGAALKELGPEIARSLRERKYFIKNSNYGDLDHSVEFLDLCELDRLKHRALRAIMPEPRQTGFWIMNYFPWNLQRQPLCDEAALTLSCIRYPETDLIAHLEGGGLVEKYLALKALEYSGAKSVALLQALINYVHVRVLFGGGGEADEREEGYSSEPRFSADHIDELVMSRLAAFGQQACEAGEALIGLIKHSAFWSQKERCLNMAAVLAAIGMPPARLAELLGDENKTLRLIAAEALRAMRNEEDPQIRAILAELS